MSLGPHDTMALLDHVHMASFLHDRALVGICISAWSVIWGPEDHRHPNKVLRPCPLRTEISPVSLKPLMMLCTLYDEICKAFEIWCWGTLFLKYSTIFLRTLSQIGEPLPIFTSERLCFSKTSLLCYRTDELLDVLFSKCLAFSALCCLCDNFLETCGRHQILNELI